jgi:hypothetical protein
MAATTGKENLLSFAFAYFMKTSPSQKGDEQHFDDWNEIFEDFKITEVKSKYKSFLEHNFDYSGLKSTYEYDKSYVNIENKKEKDKLRNLEGKKSKHIFTVYYQIEELYFSNIIDRNKNYRIYTQSSSFTQTIKDACIEKLFEVFDLSGSVQILSPVDFFIANYDDKKKIEDDFKNNILKVKNNTDILINYEKNKDKTYEHLIAKYFKSKDLIGVSHKLPEGKSKNATIKIAGNVAKLGKYDLKNIDPYSQMIIELQQKSPAQVEKLINEVIEIKYNEWDMRDNVDSSTWKLYFDFNFKKLNSQFDNAKFGLEPLPGTGSGSYNGKFHYGGSKTSPWVAGMAPNTVEQFIKQYGGYNQIMSLLVKRRITAFMSVLSDIKESEVKKSTKGAAALRFLSQKTFQSFSKTADNVEPYFIEIKQPILFEAYQKKLIEMLKREGKFMPDVDSIRTEREISHHYISIQMSYLWLFGGRNFKQYLKKRIFFTVFGAITKRGFVGITNNKLIQLAEKKYDDKRKNVKVSITSAPHLILL